MATSSLVKKFAKYFIESDGRLGDYPQPRPRTSFNRFSVDRLHQSSTESFRAKLYPTEKGKFVAGLDKSEVKVRRSKSSIDLEPRSDSTDLDLNDGSGSPHEYTRDRRFRGSFTAESATGQSSTSRNVQHLSNLNSKPPKPSVYKVSDVYLRQSMSASQPSDTVKSNEVKKREVALLENLLLESNKPKPIVTDTKLTENRATSAGRPLTSAKYRFESSFSLPTNSSNNSNNLNARPNQIQTKTKNERTDDKNQKSSSAANGATEVGEKPKVREKGKLQTVSTTQSISSRSTTRSGTTANSTTRDASKQQQQQKRSSVRREEDCIALWFDELHNKRNKDKKQ